MAEVTCFYCDEPINIRAKETYRYMAGWVQQRRQGGANALKHRREVGYFAHPVCVDESRMKGEQLDLMSVEPD